MSLDRRPTTLSLASTSHHRCSTSPTLAMNVFIEWFRCIRRPARTPTKGEFAGMLGIFVYLDGKKRRVSEPRMVSA
jgi:hypothetical protein